MSSMIHESFAGLLKSLGRLFTIYSVCKYIQSWLYLNVEKLSTPWLFSVTTNYWTEQQLLLTIKLAYLFSLPLITTAVDTTQ